MVISILIHIHGCNSCLLCFQFFKTSILILIQGCNVKTRRLMVHVNFNTHPHTRMQRQDYQEHSLQKFQYSSPCEDATAIGIHTFPYPINAYYHINVRFSINNLLRNLIFSSHQFFLVLVIRISAASS